MIFRSWFLTFSLMRTSLTAPFHDLPAAYQLHHHFVFHTKYAQPRFTSNEHSGFFEQQLLQICQRHGYHLLEHRVEPAHLRCLISLRPEHVPSDVAQRLKGALSYEIGRQFGKTGPLWGRGYFGRSVGQINLSGVKRYIAQQAEHHGYGARAFVPVVRYRHPNPPSLTLPHVAFDINYHIVLAVQYRESLFDPELAEAVLGYWQRIAEVKGFVLHRTTILPDHVHLLIAATPKVSAEQCVLAVMNNTWAYLTKRFWGALKVTRALEVWQPSYYVGTVGAATTAQVKHFLQTAARWD
jgi:putative transposase